MAFFLLYKPKKVNLVSPEELRMPSDDVGKLKSASVAVSETDKLDDVLSETDVLYVTRVQKERFSNLQVYEKLKDRFIITRDSMAKLKKTAILMHPFPRISEIAPEVDGDPRALYLREQIPNGMYVRMALLSLVLTR